MSDVEPVAELEGVVVRVDGRTILGPVDLVIRCNERWVLLGPNGGGKTTLLSIVGARRQPSEGRARVLGTTLGRGDIRALHGRISHSSHVLAELMPGEPEIRGLLALMELQASRARARTDGDGNLVLLEDQDRRRWDRARIARGLADLERAGPLDHAGPYQLQAAIAACHARADSWEATDWPWIVEHYGALAALAPSPVVELNRAVAIGLARGPAAGLAALDAIDVSALRGYHLLPAARADFLRRLGRFPEASAEYRRALRLVDNPREQTFLSGRLAACEAGGGAGP